MTRHCSYLLSNQIHIYGQGYIWEIFQINCWFVNLIRGTFDQSRDKPPPPPTPLPRPNTHCHIFATKPTPPGMTRHCSYLLSNQIHIYGQGYIWEIFQINCWFVNLIRGTFDQSRDKPPPPPTLLPRPNAHCHRFATTPLLPPGWRAVAPNY